MTDNMNTPLESHGSKAHTTPNRSQPDARQDLTHHQPAAQPNSTDTTPTHPPSPLPPIGTNHLEIHLEEAPWLKSATQLMNTEEQGPNQREVHTPTTGNGPRNEQDEEPPPAKTGPAEEYSPLSKPKTNKTRGKRGGKKAKVPLALAKAASALESTLALDSRKRQILEEANGSTRDNPSKRKTNTGYQGRGEKGVHKCLNLGSHRNTPSPSPTLTEHQHTALNKNPKTHK